MPGTVEDLFLLEKLVCHGLSLYQSRRNPGVDPLTLWVKKLPSAARSNAAVGFGDLKPQVALGVGPVVLGSC